MEKNRIEVVISSSKLRTLLSCYGSYYERLLESYKRELDSGVSRWWFHLYGLCQEASGILSIILKVKVLLVTVSWICADDDLDGFTITLQSFIEKSSLGEFCSRLLLVSTFRAEMLVKGMDFLLYTCVRLCALSFFYTGRYSLSDVLGNVHQYYSQFSAHVLSAMEKLTTVVVKDFKV